MKSRLIATGAATHLALMMLLVSPGHAAMIEHSVPAAAPLPAGQCFDFSHAEGVKALADPIAFSAPTRPDTVASGPHALGGGWGAARALLEMPTGEVLKLLRDAKVLKNPKEADLEISHDTRAGLLDLQTIAIAIHPFPLITIRWIEQWAYRLLQGTEAAPKEVLIGYQKTEGTDHIRRFCGTIWLRADTPGRTDFAVYEETDATRRTAEAIAQGHLGTLRTLRDRHGNH